LRTRRPAFNHLQIIDGRLKTTSGFCDFLSLQAKTQLAGRWPTVFVVTAERKLGGRVIARRSTAVGSSFCTYCTKRHEWPPGQALYADAFEPTKKRRLANDIKMANEKRHKF
jgi:hypothetical protein